MTTRRERKEKTKEMVVKMERTKGTMVKKVNRPRRTSQKATRKIDVMRKARMERDEKIETEEEKERSGATRTARKSEMKEQGLER